MKWRGFTIVEVTIVIVLITVLTLLGLAGMRSSQMAARDDERQVKAETIARSLEQLYRNGTTAFSMSAGRYPSVSELQSAVTNGFVDQLFEGVDESTFSYSWQENDDANLGFLGTLTAPARDQTENSSRIATAVSGGKIIYEPLAAFVGTRTAGDNDAWVSCYQIAANTPTCERFNLYFQRESDGTIVTIRSENQ